MLALVGFLYGTAEAWLALGNAVRLGNQAQAALSLGTIKAHVARAIELNPAHARALQFMGG